GSGAAIKEFIDDVADMARESAERDYAIVLERLREDHPGARAVSLADKDYYAELVRKEWLGVDAGKVREYFSFDRVVRGMLDLTERLFGIQFTRVQVPVWHEDVQAYDVTLVSGDEADIPLGRAYLDLHPRAGKFGHAAQFSLVDGIAGVQLAAGSSITMTSSPCSTNSATFCITYSPAGAATPGSPASPRNGISSRLPVRCSRSGRGIRTSSRPSRSTPTVSRYRRISP